MSWETVVKAAKSSLSSGVSVGVHEIGAGKNAKRLRLVNVCWVDAPDWFANGKPVSVQIGRDEHAGSLRIVKGGSVEVLPRKSTSRGTTRVLVKAWPDVPGPTPSILCKHEMDGDAVVITLPWAATPTARLAATPEPVRAAPPAVPVPKPILTTPPAARPTANGLTAASGAPTIASRDTIQQWGSQRGIVTDKLDLERVNKKRRDLQLPPFEIEPSRGGARA